MVYNSTSITVNSSFCLYEENYQDMPCLECCECSKIVSLGGINYMKEHLLSITNDEEIVNQTYWPIELFCTCENSEIWNYTN